LSQFNHDTHAVLSKEKISLCLSSLTGVATIMEKLEQKERMRASNYLLISLSASYSLGLNQAKL
jgi:hypothetical protein